jgi:hypothetical protein
LDKNARIEIIPVSNGFVVRPAYDFRRGGEVGPPDESVVFQTFGALNRWLLEHFTHRCSSVVIDPTSSPMPQPAPHGGL